MGANSSKQKVLNETLNNIQIELMTKNSTSMNSSTTQSNVYYVNNDGGNVTVDGVTQENIAKINLSSLANSKRYWDWASRNITTVKDKEVAEASPKTGVTNVGLFFLI
jgi:uncharacterized protein with ATP-grasp and redox domains